MALENLELIPLPMFITDEKGKIQKYNRKSQGLLQDIQIGISYEQLFEIQDEEENNMIYVKRGAQYYVLLIEKISPKLSINVIIDGTNFYELHKKLKELDKANKELDAIIESSYDGIYITDNQGVTLKTNSAIERITGIPKHYYIGKNIQDLIGRGILKESVTTKVLERRATVSVVQKNFNHKETLLTGNPIFNEQGEVEKVVTNIRDLSELNHLHSELNKVQKLNEQYKRELEKLKAVSIQNSDVVLKSKKMLELFTIAERLANVDATVLVLGETGVGKDVFARHLYRVSDRFDKGKFVKINCGAIPKDLLESELFGYEGGAFSGASKAGKIGMFELAHDGILFLDEVGELPLDLQVKLLRVLQEKEIQRIGGTKTKKIDVRVIAATNRDLREMVKEGKFREDLYYRLHVVPILIPPLRERKDDILPLVQHFIDQCNSKYKISKTIDRGLREYFYLYEWPGNVRELANLVERLMLTIPAKTLTFDDLPEEYREKKERNKSSEIQSLTEAVEEAERKILQQAVQKWGTTYEIANQLSSSQATIVRKLRKYQLSTHK